MSTLAEIERAAEKLPITEQRELFCFLAARLHRSDKPAPRPYRTRPHPGSFLPGIDGDKIGQFVDEL